MSSRRAGGGTAFGAKTLAGAGGVAVTGTSITSGDASGHWTITGGYLVPSATGDTADLNLGPYNLVFDDASTLTVSILANAAHVRDAPQLLTAAVSTERAFGDQVILRDGIGYNSDDAGTSRRIQRTQAPSGTWNGSNYIVIRPETPYGATIDRLGVTGTSFTAAYISFENLVFNCDNGGTNSSAVTFFSLPSHVQFKSNRFWGTADPLRTNASDLVGGINALVSNGNINIIDNDFQDLERPIGIETNNVACIIRGNRARRFWGDGIQITPPASNLLVEGNDFTDKLAAYTETAITNITLGASTVVTVSDPTGITVGTSFIVIDETTGFDEGIGNIYTASSVVGNDVTLNVNSTGFTAWTSGGVVRHTTSHPDYIQGAFGGNYSTTSAVTRGATTQVTVDTGDGPLFVPGQPAYAYNFVGITELNGNEYTIVSVAGDVVTLSVDSSAFAAYTSGGRLKYTGVTGDFDDIVIRGNRMTFGQGVNYLSDGQAFFFDDNTAPVRRMIIEGNIGEQKMQNGIFVRRAQDCIIRHNTIMRKLGHLKSSGSTKISLESPVGTGNRVYGNVSNNYTITSALIDHNNSTLAQNSTAYDAAFVSPPTGLEATVAATDYAPLGGGTLAVIDPIPGALPHQSFTSPYTFTAPAYGGAPVLSSPVDTTNGAGGMTGSVSTTLGNGALYYVITTSATVPSAAQIKAGTDHADAAARVAVSQEVEATGAQNIATSGLLASTTYYTHFYHENVTGNGSNIVSGDGFTTDVLPAIALVGSKSLSFIGNGSLGPYSLTDLTGGLDSAPAEDDLVVVLWAMASTSTNTLTISTSGYTATTSTFANSTNDTNAILAYKVMTATPDTDITFGSSSSSSSGCRGFVIQVWRGVDTTTPLDGVAVAIASATNTRIPDPGTITPTTSGGKIIVAAANAHADGDLALSASYLSDVVTANRDGSTHDQSLLMGSVDWTSGSYNPAALTISGDATSNSYVAFTAVLKPA
jgi:hypothetical protein